MDAHLGLADARFGPLQPFLDDPTVEELWINAPDRIFVARDGRSELTSLVLTDGQVRDLVERMLRGTGRRLDLSTPFVDSTLPDGSRLHAVIPDIVPQHWSINVRKFVARAGTVQELAAEGLLTQQAAAFLHASVVSGLNILVSGGTGAGKTTTLGCLLASVPAHERIVTCEEVLELRLRHPDWVRMQTRPASLEGTGAVPLRRLVKASLRMRPDRLVIGEVRQAEALDLLIAMNSGQPALATLHANSAAEAVTKLCTLPLLAGANITSGFVVPTVAAAVDLVVHLRPTPDGRRRVEEITAVTGESDGRSVATEPVFARRAGRLVRDVGRPRREERFAAHGFRLDSLLRSGAR